MKVAVVSCLVSPAMPVFLTPVFTLLHALLSVLALVPSEVLEEHVDCE